MVSEVRKAIIYLITYPNGKIYVGKDMTNSINYFGSADDTLVARDFGDEQRRDFVVRRTVLWESSTATLQEVNRMEVQLIRQWKANDPNTGYNRWPRFRPNALTASSCANGQEGPWASESVY
ncbi:hypothetical protein [Solimonas variicoloris]|uniref:hypothetical protein n=1 Tax=Solimonas variicoloris TaxID=254408 RepID=UPI000372BA5F|nr:hypothetical protein [Solimonas variicoloris]